MIGRQTPPLGAGAFARLMAPFEPFETSPVLAVAVSGGRDSLALALLSHAWTAERDGRVVGLIVDHGLRAESAVEAAATSGTCSVNHPSAFVEAATQWWAHSMSSSSQASTSTLGNGSPVMPSTMRS